MSIAITLLKKKRYQEDPSTAQGPEKSHAAGLPAQHISGRKSWLSPKWTGEAHHHPSFLLPNKSRKADARRPMASSCPRHRPLRRVDDGDARSRRGLRDCRPAVTRGRASSPSPYLMLYFDAWSIHTQHKELNITNIGSKKVKKININKILNLEHSLRKPPSKPN